MIQAARSGRQNIAEGSRAAATSSQTELRLLNVARSSQEELLLDYEEEVEALFDAMHRVLVETAAILAEFDPGDALWMTENTSTTLISPGQFRHYCMQHLREYAEICRSFGKPLFLHMCGHLKALLPDLETLPVHGFEAFTTPSLGNTTLLDGRTACPTKCLASMMEASSCVRASRSICVSK